MCKVKTADILWSQRCTFLSIGQKGRKKEGGRERQMKGWERERGGDIEREEREGERGITMEWTFSECIRLKLQDILWSQGCTFLPSGFRRGERQGERETD